MPALPPWSAAPIADATALAPGDWYASAGTGQAWIDDAAAEIAWDQPPFADAYILSRAIS
jgi:hypothetical protein